MDYETLAKELIDEIAPSILADLGDCSAVSEEEEYNLLYYIRTAILRCDNTKELEQKAKGVLKQVYKLVSQYNSANR